MNPKLIISNYFDSLINQIDIHTEEVLEKTKENALILTDKPFKYEFESITNRQFDFNYWKISHDAGDHFIQNPYDSHYKYDFSHQPSKYIPPGSVRVKDF